MKQPQNLRVLIADDDPLVCEMIQGILEEMNYTVIGRAADGREAIAMTEHMHPDVIIMDLKMPNMGGIEASNHIYQQFATAVVMLTAYENIELVEQASAAGIGAYLVKPPNARDLDRAITVAMARFEDLVQLRKLNTRLNAQNKSLEEALATVKRLSGLLPICMHCKKIRTDSGYWQEVELYVREHSEAEFSHSLCPDCLQEHYPGFLSNRHKSE